MRKLITSAAFLVIGVGAASTANAQFSLKGSDTLEAVTKDVLAACPAAAGIVYTGGGSGGGQSAMVANQQQIAPMSRELNNAASCIPGNSELIIGLDGVSVVGANQTGGNSESTDPANVCSDTISGGNRQMIVRLGGSGTFPTTTIPDTAGCTPGEIQAGACSVTTETVTGIGSTAVHRYTFKSWKDVLAMVYGGQNNTTTAQTLSDKSRNPNRIDCGGSIRRTLLDNWSQIFTNDAVGTHAPCRTGTCTRLKHAFRRDDLSGTTDTFVALVGLVAIPPFTTTFSGNVPKPDGAATVNPFCNAGEKLMNKGDSDYLDMDPVRRIADSGTAAQNRQGKEQVSQGFLAPINPPAAGGGDAREIDDPNAAASANKLLSPLPDFSHPAAPNWSFDPNTTNAIALQRASFRTNDTNTFQGNAREGLGVVLSISVPTNFGPFVAPGTDPHTRAYWEGVGVTATDAVFPAPVPCTPGKFAGSIICTTCINILNPDGSTGIAALPVDTTIVGTPTAPNFNCVSDRASPNPPPGAVQLRDPRVFNLLVLDQGGKVVKDAYLNQSISLSATRQNRVVSAFYRLHVGEVTNFGGTPKIAGNPTPGTRSSVTVCNQFDSTQQIGCLVRANPCSIGFAGREANNNSTTFASQLEGIQANTLNIKGFAHQTPGFYPMSRALYINSVKGFGAVTNVAPSDNELALLTCFGGGPGAGGPNDPTNPTSPVHTSMSVHGFVPIDAADLPLDSRLTDCTTTP